MPSRNNPNVPTAQKPKSAYKIGKNRQKIQRITHRNANKIAPARTSQAIRKAAPISNKKARKLETKKLHARNRALEEAIQAGEVEMRDVDSRSGKGKVTDIDSGGMEAADERKGEEMVVD